MWLFKKSGFREFLGISGRFYGDFRCPRAAEIPIFARNPKNNAKSPRGKASGKEEYTGARSDFTRAATAYCLADPWPITFFCRFPLNYVSAA